MQTLTNKTVTAPTISSPTLSGTVTGTYTLGGAPTFPATVVTTTGSQTLTNKVLTAPTINTPTITNPTLTTDSINEFTSANGVTVDGLNIKDGKLNTNNSVVTANITDASVTYAKLSSEVWWQELARYTASGAVSTLDTSTFTTKKYLRIMAYGIPTATTGAMGLQFNGDTGLNYYYRVSDNGGADTTGNLGQIPWDTASGNADRVQLDVMIVNIAARQKVVSGLAVSDGNGGTGIPRRRELACKWTDTTNQINRIVVTINATTFATGSEIIVLGHD